MGSLPGKTFGGKGRSLEQDGEEGPEWDEREAVTSGVRKRRGMGTSRQRTPGRARGLRADAGRASPAAWRAL